MYVASLLYLTKREIIIMDALLCVFFSHLAEELIWRDITKLLLHLQVYDIIMFDDIIHLQIVGSFKAFEHEKSTCNHSEVSLLLT